MIRNLGFLSRRSVIKPNTLYRTNANYVELTINDQPVRVPPDTTILKAAEVLGIEIPRFCYHDRLSIAGNCRMCLVEQVGAPKPAASCAAPVFPGMKINTHSNAALKAREGVMEFILANHPLDCPACDQGGECDLQDQSIAFGGDRSRFEEPKTAMADKNLGPFVKTVMTRCITCTRCVRFSNQVAGNPSLGVSGRGNDSQIGNYINLSGMLESELSGCLIDVCPVGALTSKPFAFKSRSWESRRAESICTLDGTGSNIQVINRSGDLLKVIPAIKDDLNIEYIGDKTRFSYDGATRQRLQSCYIKIDGKLQPVNFATALKFVAQKMMKNVGSPSKICAVAGAQTDAETMMSMIDLLGATTQSTENVYTEDSFPGDATNRMNYLFNSSFEGVDNSDLILLIGTNPRFEATVLNARIRNAWYSYEADVAFIGPKDLNLTYDYENLGPDTNIIDDLISGKNEFSQQLKTAKNPMIILGSGAVQGEDGAIIIEKVKKLCSKYNVAYNYLHKTASPPAALDLGFKGTGLQSAVDNAKLVFNLGADENKFTRNDDQTVVYIGSHGDNGAKNADIILPGACSFEKRATFMNTEGRAQTTRPATKVKGGREDWQIIRALSEVFADETNLISTLAYDDLQMLRDRIENFAPHVVDYDYVPRLRYVPSEDALNQELVNGEIVNEFDVDQKVIGEYYQTCAMTRASKYMADGVEASKKIVADEQFIEKM